MFSPPISASLLMCLRVHWDRWTRTDDEGVRSSTVSVAVVVIRSFTPRKIWGLPQNLWVRMYSCAPDYACSTPEISRNEIFLTITTVKYGQRLPEYKTSRDPPCQILSTHSAEKPKIGTMFYANKSVFHNSLIINIPVFHYSIIPVPMGQ